MIDFQYKMIFKRKSFHFFKEISLITEEEIKDIKTRYNIIKPLVDNIETKIEIVPSNEVDFKRGGEYCILFYSEIKDNYLSNIGYLGEQLDLYLASINIGSLWYGIGKVKKKNIDNLNFVIMIGISKVKEQNFRKDMFKIKRKSLDEIMTTKYYQDIINIARFAPSACNTQPWFIETSITDIKVYRYKKPGKRGIMPIDKVIYYNKIDIGIFILFLDTILDYNNINYRRLLLKDETDKEMNLFAIYEIGGKNE